ncbi:hypothetical protein AAG570_001487 [Ranatra chinensis]|uniref:CRAL-TRIO domain-containing protein n=1 Tax=Ranatra chinensis TaxID=642074 RepID=A0ABD0Y9I0_9HEMI
MVRTDDAFLAAFLRGRKHDVNKAFQCLKNFYEFKARYPDFYSYLMPSEKPELYDLNHFASLPGLDRKGRKICACVPARIDLEVAPLSDTFKMGTAILELMLNDLHLQVTGTVVIFDLAEFSIIQQARIATPTSAWHLAMIAQDKIPLRVKAVHVLNQPFYFSALYAVFRPFLKKKLRKRIYLHGSDMSSLHKHIAPENLPVEWGGHRESFTAKLTKTLLHLNEHKFKGF